MIPMLGRRHFMSGALAAGALVGARAGASSPMSRQWGLHLGRDIERQYGGRLGFAVAFSSGGIVNWRGHERFAFCSSFKLSLAALVLTGAEKGEWRLDEKLPFGKGEVLSNSPALQTRMGLGSISMAEAAEAVQKQSDNGAANLLMRRMGGFDRVNRFWRGLGDMVSRLDDYETALNRVPPGSLRNTTTPEAMADNLLRMFRQRALSPAVVTRLKGWMHDTTTGAKRLRAGLPGNWWAGDKTGTGLPADIPGTYVDLAWVEPPDLAPFAIAAFYQPPKPTPDGDSNAETVLAQVGQNIAQTIVLQGK